MNRTFKEELINKELLIGTDLSLPSPEVAEILEIAGFDWLFIDFEHSIMTIEHIQRIIQSVNIPCLIRCPSNEEIWIKKSLDAGAAGIIIPQIKTLEQAKNIVKYSKYRPLGERCTGIGRAHKYGVEFKEYLTNANSEVSTIIQIENKEAVDLIDDLTAIAGIDAVFIGPLDLSDSLGEAGNINSKKVENAINKVIISCNKSNIPIGIFASDYNFAQKYIINGITLVAVSADVLMLGKAAKELRNKF